MKFYIYLINNCRNLPWLSKIMILISTVEIIQFNTLQCLVMSLWKQVCPVDIVMAEVPPVMKQQLFFSYVGLNYAGCSSDFIKINEFVFNTKRDLV